MFSWRLHQHHRVKILQPQQCSQHFPSPPLEKCSFYSQMSATILAPPASQGKECSLHFPHHADVHYLHGRTHCKVKSTSCSRAVPTSPRSDKRRKRIGGKPNRTKSRLTTLGRFGTKSTATETITPLMQSLLVCLAEAEAVVATEARVAPLHRQVCLLLLLPPILPPAPALVLHHPLPAAAAAAMRVVWCKL